MGSIKIEALSNVEHYGTFYSIPKFRQYIKKNKLGPLSGAGWPVCITPWGFGALTDKAIIINKNNVYYVDYDEKVNKYSLTEVKDVIMVVGVIWIDGLFDLD